MKTWYQIAESEEWRQFWSSEEIRAIKDGTVRMLTHGRKLDAVEIARLQSRIQVLEEIEALPGKIAKSEQEARERNVIRSVAEGGPRLASLPRID